MLTQRTTLPPYLAELNAALTRATAPAVENHVRSQASEALSPALRFIHVKRRDMELQGDSVMALAGGSGWRHVGYWDRQENPIRNTPKRELALNIGDFQKPMLDTDTTIQRFYEILLDWAGDTRKRAFLRGLTKRYPTLINADSRALDASIEKLAGICFEDCKKNLGIDASQEALMLAHSWHSKQKFREYPNACKVWMVLVLMWMVKLDV